MRLLHRCTQQTLRKLEVPRMEAGEEYARHVFFFSSRRRHTRCSRDWSSDVCSSDLETRAPQPGAKPGDPRVTQNLEEAAIGINAALEQLVPVPLGVRHHRPKLEDQIGRASCRERV